MSDACNANPLLFMGKAAKDASLVLAGLGASHKNALLAALADALEAGAHRILAANALDMQAAKASGMQASLMDRLALDKKRLAAIAADVRSVCALADPVGETLDGKELDGNGNFAHSLRLERRRVPLGVVAAIYEARPNVTVDVTALCLKTGNAVILRGGKETAQSNQALTAVIQECLAQQGLPAQAVQSVTSPERELVTALLHLDAYVDMLIPRGGPGLHRLCREQSRIPVITGGIGVCHTYVSRYANLERCLPVIENAKVQRPSACNSLETLLVHKDVARDFLPLLAERMQTFGCVMHAHESALPFLKDAPGRVVPVIDGDFDKEWLCNDFNVAVVNSLDEALAHIRTHGTAHSEAILTENMAEADAFVARVDAAAVYVNASTRFTDGSQFGLGAEVAISTQKLHARGPMALNALTTYKWIGRGDYSTRA